MSVHGEDAALSQQRRRVVAAMAHSKRLGIRGYGAIDILQVLCEDGDVTEWLHSQV